MSKVDELRTKFPQVTNGTFIKMVQFDFTGTHKYSFLLVPAYKRIEK